MGNTEPAFLLPVDAMMQGRYLYVDVIFDTVHTLPAFKRMNTLIVGFLYL